MARILHSGMARYGRDLQRRSAAIPRALENRIRAIAGGWLLLFLALSAPRIATSPTPVHGIGDFLQLALPYLLIAFAPIAGFLLAAGTFPAGVMLAQPDFRLAVYGRWRRLNIFDARANPAYGPAGFMASLLLGLLLNVVMRSFEFLLALPALNGHAPGWGTSLFLIMTADVVVMSFFYMVCFVMALRNIPYFPRMLLFAWGLDIVAQLIIAHRIGTIDALPISVAASLQDLLRGNIAKVLISAAVWLPYLILSDRVNITYRQRIRAT